MNAAVDGIQRQADRTAGPPTRNDGLTSSANPSLPQTYRGTLTQRASSCPRFSSAGYRAWHVVVAAVFAAAKEPAIAVLWDPA